MIVVICESHVTDYRILLTPFSYHLLYGASLLQAFSLFMLSLARPGNFYQVLIHSVHFVAQN